MSYLEPADPNDTIFAKEKLRTGWLHPHKKCPRVAHVYKILMADHFWDNHTKYQCDRVETIIETDRFQSVEFLFHGTTRDCYLGDGGHTDLCDSPECSLCGIIRESYTLSLAGKKTGFLRFGRVIYTSSVSSQADDYSENLGPSRYKAMLLNSMVKGKTYQTYEDMKQLTTECVRGYDSVTGEPGIRLKYGEVAVYDGDAILPMFLVIYDPRGDENITSVERIRDIAPRIVVPPRSTTTSKRGDGSSSCTVQ